MLEAARLFVTVGANTREAERGLQSFQQRLNNAARNLTLTGGMMTAGITLPLLAAGKQVAGIGISYESAFAGVTKTVSGTKEEMAALNDGIRDMAMGLPATANEIAGVAEAAGALGIAKENILDFTQVMVDLGETTNLTSDTAASELARFANITGMLQTDFDRLGSALVALGNDGASTEAEIVSMGMRIAAAGTQIGMSEASILGWASALSSLGIEAEAGGTAISRVMIDMAQAVALGGNQLELFAGIADMSTAQFRELFASDSSAALLQFVSGLGDLQAAGGNVFQTLEDLGFADVRVRDTLLRLTGANDLVAASLATSNEAWAENTALANEAAIRYETTESQIAILGNRFKNMAITLKEVAGATTGPLLTNFNAFVLTLDSGLTALADTNPALITMAMGLTGVVAAAGPLMLVMGGVAKAFAFLGSTVGFLLTPLGLIVAASALLAAAWAADFGGIQAVTATVAGQVQQGFQTMLGSAQQLASGMATAFRNTSFPSLQALWEQFKGGDFETVATTIRDTAFELLVNLNTELNITGQADQLRGQLTGLANAISTAIGGLDFGAARAKLDGLRDGVLSSLSAAIEGIDFGQASTSFSGLVSGLTEAVNSLDLSGIDWTAVFQRILLGPMGTALTAVQWVVGSENFAGLTSAVRGAFGEINWGEIGTSLVGLGTAIRTQLGAIVTDMASDLGLALPDVQFDFTGMIDTLTTSINNQDWTALGSGLVSSIGTGFETVMAADVSWAENFANNFAASVRGAFASVDWGALDSSLTGLATAIREAIYGLATGIGQEINLSIPDIQWDAIMESFTWADWMQTLSWDTWVGTLSWEEFVAGIEWASFVPGVSWNSFVPNLSWSAFVDGLNWGSFIPDVSWSSFVPSLDWSRFISWLKIPGFASGTDFAPGGLALVGEQGPELVNLPRGSRVYNHQETAAMVSGGGGITVHVHVASVASDMDIESLATRVARKIQRKMS